MKRSLTRVLLVGSIAADGAGFARRRGGRSSRGPLRRRQRLECECRRRRARGLPGSRQQPAARIASVRRDAPGRPRRAECDRASLASLRLRHAATAAGRLARCRGGGGGTRRVGAAARGTPRALLGLRARGRRERRDRLRGGARSDHRRSAQGSRGFNSGAPPRPRSSPCGPGTARTHRWSTTSTRRETLPASTASLRASLRVRAWLGGRHPVRAQGQLAVPRRSSLRGDHQEVCRGLRRGQASRRRRRHHTQRPHRRADRDRPLLGRELPAAVEPDRPQRLREPKTRSVGPGAPVRPAQHGARGRLHRLLRDQVLLRLLAPGDRDTASRHRRQPEHERRPDLDPAGAHASDPGPRLGAQRRRRCRSRGDAAVLRHRSDRLQDLQPDACSRQHLHRPRTGHAQVRQLLRGGRRERTVTHPHRVPLPQRGPGRNRARPQDRRPRHRPVPAPARADRSSGLGKRGPAERGLARSPAAWATRRPAAPTSARRQRNVSGPRCTPPP